MFFVWGPGLAQALSCNYFAAEVNAIFFPPFMFSDHGLTPLVSVLDVGEWALPHRPDACVCVRGSGPWSFACLWDNQSSSCFKILIRLHVVLILHIPHLENVLWGNCPRSCPPVPRHHRPVLDLPALRADRCPRPGLHLCICP